MSPHDHGQSAHEFDAREPLCGGTSRRLFMLMGLGLLAGGCAAPQPTRQARALPGPEWPDRVPPPSGRAPGPITRVPDPNLPAGVIPRAQWAKAQPAPTLMNRMLPVRYITVHHDGMTPFYGDSTGAAAERLELIRRAHRNKNWGDIGYHYVIDRGGRVWEGRAIAYQGAHVKDHNEGNVGVMCLGNFDEQTPTAAQLDSLNRHLTLLMRQFNVSTRQVRTHQEWAVTACPGRTLQRHMESARSRYAIG